MIDEQDPAVLAYAKTYTHSDRLFDSLNALEEVGGIARAAEAAGWSPKALNKALASLRATRDAIDAQLAAIEGSGSDRKPKPAPKPAPRPNPIPTSATASGPLARRITSQRNPG